MLLALCHMIRTIHGDPGPWATREGAREHQKWGSVLPRPPVANTMKHTTFELCESRGIHNYLII